MQQLRYVTNLYCQYKVDGYANALQTGGSAHCRCKHKGRKEDARRGLQAAAVSDRRLRSTSRRQEPATSHS